MGKKTPTKKAQKTDTLSVKKKKKIYDSEHFKHKLARYEKFKEENKVILEKVPGKFASKCGVVHRTKKINVNDLKKAASPKMMYFKFERPQKSYSSDTTDILKALYTKHVKDVVDVIAENGGVVNKDTLDYAENVLYIGPHNRKSTLKSIKGFVVQNAFKSLGKTLVK